MNPSNLKPVRDMGMAYLYVWIMTVISGVFSIWIFRGFDLSGDILEQGVTIIILLSLIFFISLGILINGIISAVKFSKWLKDTDINGGIYFKAAMILMLISLLLSMQSIPGISVRFSLLIALKFTEIFADMAWIGVMTLIAMFAFVASVILNYIGVAKIADGEKDKYDAIEGFREVKKWAMLLMLTTIIFSPVLLCYVAASTDKYESTLLLNVIAAISYIVTLVFFFITWFRAQHSRIIPADEIQSQTFIPLDNGVKIIIGKMGKIYLWTWIDILVSLLVLTRYYDTWSSGWKIVSIIPYIAGWIVVFLGIIYSVRLNKIFSKIGIKDCKYIIAGYITLGVTSMLSLNSIFGGSFYLNSELDWNEMFDILLDPSFIGSDLQSTVSYTSILALFLFILFPIFSLVATFRLSAYIPALKKASAGALTLALASIIFAPLLICMAIDNGEDGAYGYLFLGLCFYLAGLYFFALPWGKCEKIKDMPEAYNLSVTDEDKILDKLTIRDTIGIVKKDRISCAVLIVAIISISLSIIAVSMSLVNRSTYKRDFPAIEAKGKLTLDYKKGKPTHSHSVHSHKDVNDNSDKEEESFKYTEISEEEVNVENNTEHEETIIRELYSIVLADFMDAPSESKIKAFEKKYMSSAMIRKLKTANPYDDESVFYADLRTELQDGDGDSKLLSITPLSGGWYKVKYLDMGERGETDIKIENDKITDYRKH